MILGGITAGSGTASVLLEIGKPVTCSGEGRRERGAAAAGDQRCELVRVLYRPLVSAEDATRLWVISESLTRTALPTS